MVSRSRQARYRLNQALDGRGARLAFRLKERVAAYFGRREASQKANDPATCLQCRGIPAHTLPAENQLSPTVSGWECWSASRRLRSGASSADRTQIRGPAAAPPSYSVAARTLRQPSTLGSPTPAPPGGR